MAPPFFIVLADHDHGAFDVLGPMADDTGWATIVWRLQRMGRDVTCSTVRTGSADAIAAAYIEQFGYRLLRRQIDLL